MVCPCCSQAGKCCCTSTDVYDLPDGDECPGTIIAKTDPVVIEPEFSISWCGLNITETLNGGNMGPFSVTGSKQSWGTCQPIFYPDDPLWEVRWGTPILGVGVLELRYPCNVPKLTGLVQTIVEGEMYYNNIFSSIVNSIRTYDLFWAQRCGGGVTLTLNEGFSGSACVGGGFNLPACNYAPTVTITVAP